MRTGSIFLLLALPVLAQGRPDPQALLDSSLMEPQVSYQGEMHVTHWYGDRVRAEVVKVFFLPPGRYRREAVLPDGRVGHVSVSDGETEEFRLAKTGKVLQGSAIKSSPKLMAQEQEKELLLRNYKVVLVGGEHVAGRKAWVVELKPSLNDRPRQRLTIDEETRVILENKRFRPGGLLAASSVFVRFEPGVHLPEGLFNVSPDTASGTFSHGFDPNFLSLEELDHVKGQSFFPRELPGGFVFESGDFLDVSGRTVKHVRYTDGLAVLSLFQTDRPVRLPASLSAAGHSEMGALRLSSAGKVLHWKSGRVHYTLIGDVSKELLEKAAVSLKGPKNAN